MRLWRRLLSRQVVDALLQHAEKVLGRSQTVRRGTAGVIEHAGAYLILQLHQLGEGAAPADALCGCLIHGQGSSNGSQGMRAALATP